MCNSLSELLHLLQEGSAGGRYDVPTIIIIDALMYAVCCMYMHMRALPSNKIKRIDCSVALTSFHSRLAFCMAFSISTVSVTAGFAAFVATVGDSAASA